MMQEIVTANNGRDEFTVPVPPDHDLQGSYRFFLVESVEHGLVVPDTVLREIHSVTEFDIWQR